MFSNWHNRSQNVIKYLKTKIFSSEAAKQITTKIVSGQELLKSLSQSFFDQIEIKFGNIVQ